MTKKVWEIFDCDGPLLGVWSARYDHNFIGRNPITAD